MMSKKYSRKQILDKLLHLSTSDFACESMTDFFIKIMLCLECKHYTLKNKKPFCQAAYPDDDAELGSKYVELCSKFETKEGSDFKLDGMTRKAILDIQNELEEILND